jgi:hypothetical protein
MLLGISVPALWLALGALAFLKVVSYLVLQPLVGKRAGRAADGGRAPIAVSD